MKGVFSVPPNVNAVNTSCHPTLLLCLSPSPLESITVTLSKKLSMSGLLKISITSVWMVVRCMITCFTDASSRNVGAKSALAVGSALSSAKKARKID